ncbi:uncharacterized protein E5676_scaffold304G00370 [Cucumis melo var. makuwa]|uniref:Retrotransposon gag domain-containing protein n=1 Tax=Cucumis melo var. makuwa TaxID=1194695 RepID=A0A5D3CJL4_CUCMM|nr:uncharacterized protein E5676_scaffold304G00370 [Cucumis melo var. makuwa]
MLFSNSLSILEVHKSYQKLYLVSCRVSENEDFYVYFINCGYVLRKLWVLEVRISNLENLKMPRGNRPSLQTGELDKTVIFLLSTLSVLCDNDAVVEIELPVPDTLPTLFYKPSDVRAASYVCWEGSAGIVRGDDVCWLHAVCRAKIAGGPGGGVMPPRTSRRRRQNQDGMQSAQEIGRPERARPSDPEKMYGIERLKKLGATVFEGSTDLADADAWLNMLEKCFDVMSCPQERKVRLATFLLQKEAEGWWKSIIARCNDARTLDWQTFRGIFEEKYYPTTYCEAKRDEFLELKQGSLSVAEYEMKYTELSRYAEMIVASESERCRRFERGLRFEIRTLVTTIAKWTNFSQLVEIALCVE